MSLYAKIPSKKSEIKGSSSSAHMELAGISLSQSRPDLPTPRRVIINGVVAAVLFLFAGFLADVYFGRYKVIKVSIWIMWLGSVGALCY